jgi:hypothetical protein
MKKRKATEPVRRLNETAAGGFFLVERILYDLSDGRASLPRLRAGEVIQRIGGGSEITVAKADGSLAYVSPLHANTIQVRPYKGKKRPARSKATRSKARAS